MAYRFTCSLYVCALRLGMFLTGPLFTVPTLWRGLPVFSYFRELGQAEQASHAVPRWVLVVF